MHRSDSDASRDVNVLAPKSFESGCCQIADPPTIRAAFSGAGPASCLLRKEGDVAKLVYRLIAVVILLQAVGCGYARNWWGPQGTMKQQQLEASVYDPYAAPDVGPEVVGSRPLDFQKPLAEPVRNSRPPNSLWGR